MITALSILYFGDRDIFDVISVNGISLSANKNIITKIANTHDTNNNNYGQKNLKSNQPANILIDGI